jgi:hypothetical protein
MGYPGLAKSGTLWTTATVPHMLARTLYTPAAVNPLTRGDPVAALRERVVH